MLRCGVSPLLRQNWKWILIKAAYGIDSDGRDWAKSENGRRDNAAK